jgi:photosystem II stability/assembly factor-like uncharacterized protein
MINRIRKIGIIPFLSAFFILILFYAVLESSEGFKEPIYTFDHRDLFFDITTINKNRAVIAGLHGRILVSHSRYNNLWSPRDSKTKEALTCLSFIDGKNGWAAGHGGVVIRTSDGGETWTVLREGSVDNQPLLDLQFVSINVGYACGAYDTILKTTDGGRTWQNLRTGLDIIHNTLAFYNENTGFLAGEFGTILKTVNGGFSWTKMNTNGFKGTFNGINIMPSGKIIAYGMKGKILMSYNGGLSWNDIKSGTIESLFRAAFSGKDVAIVGRQGVVLLSNDEGKSFSVKLEEDLTAFSGVCAYPGGGFLCVGEMGTIYKVEAIKL